METRSKVQEECTENKTESNIGEERPDEKPDHPSLIKAVRTACLLIKQLPDLPTAAMEVLMHHQGALKEITEGLVTAVIRSGCFNEKNVEFKVGATLSKYRNQILRSSLSSPRANPAPQPPMNITELTSTEFISTPKPGNS